MTSKKILFITPYEFRNPQSGGENRMNAIYSALAKTHEVRLVTRGDTNHVHRSNDAILNKKGKAAQIFNFKLFYMLWHEIRNRSIETIFVSTLWSGFIGGLLKLFTGRRLVLDDHNVEFIRFLRTKSILFPFIYLFELVITAWADTVIMVSEHDAAQAHKCLFVRRKKILVINNGFKKSLTFNKIDFKEKFGLNIEPRKKILFYGELDYRPNKEALDVIETHIAPVLFNENVAILIAGRGKMHPSEKNVYHVGFVRNIQDLIHSVDLVIVPLTSGSGTRLKILEAVGAGTRVLSTKIGAEGINQSMAGDNLEIVADNDWAAFTKKILENLKKGKSKTPAEFYGAYQWNNTLNESLLAKI